MKAVPPVPYHHIKQGELEFGNLIVMARFIPYALIIFAAISTISAIALDVFGPWRMKDDPEVNMNASQLIESKGYPYQGYSVVTEDGFILGVQRIPYGRNETKYTPRPVVFLQHGLLCSSTNWITNLVNESLGFLLADAGYDVWLGNARGNTYSLKHTHYRPYQAEFWDWSWDQMARYDLPAMLNFALNVTNQSHLHYVAHSQGTMMGFAGFPQHKELAKKVNTFYALAPVSTVGSMTSPLRYMAKFLPEIKFLFKIFGVKDFLPSDWIIQWMAKDLCKKTEEIFCSSILFVICGFDLTNLNETRLPVYLSHTPSGTSVQNIVHFAQMINSDLFQMYDYGSDAENMKRYNTTKPPLYFPENMTTPTVIFSGGMDWLADPTDVKKLLPRIPNLLNATYLPTYDHLDFIWGLNAADKVYKPIIDMIRKNELADVKLKFHKKGFS